VPSVASWQHYRIYGSHLDSRLDVYPALRELVASGALESITLPRSPRQFVSSGRRVDFHNPAYVPIDDKDWTGCTKGIYRVVLHQSGLFS
jgi:hypothetical protein